MKKIYIREEDMPKACIFCQFLVCGYCVALSRKGDPKFCPLHSIENHDREVKRKVLADLATAIEEQSK